MRLRLASLMVAAVTVAAATSACGGSADRLVVYSGRSKELINPILKRFSKDTGIKIDVRYGDSGDLALALDEEGERTDADVFISQSPGAVSYVEGKNLLGELPARVLAKVAAEDRSPQAEWVGLTGRVRVLVYNKDQVQADDLPDSIFDLTAPAYEGKVGIAPTNASFQDFVTYLAGSESTARARRWLKGMADNNSPTYANNVAIVEAVADGDIPFGLVNHYYIAQAAAEDPDTAAAVHFFPAGDPGSLLLVTAAAQLKSTDREAEGRKLVEYLLSDESQTYFATETDEYPLVSGIEAADTVVPLDDIEVTRTDLDALGKGLKATQQLIERSGLGP